MKSLRTGSIFYTNKFTTKTGSARITANIKSPQSIVAMAIDVKDISEPTSREDILAALNPIGWILIDDVKDVLGQEAYDKVVAHLKKRYEAYEESERLKEASSEIMPYKEEDHMKFYKCKRREFRVVTWWGDNDSLAGIGNLDVSSMEDLDNPSILEVWDHNNKKFRLENGDRVVRTSKKFFVVPKDQSLTKFMENYK